MLWRIELANKYKVKNLQISMALNQRLQDIVVLFATEDCLSSVKDFEKLIV
jgi:hypothetical protein